MIKLATFVTTYEHSLAALNAEANEIKRKIQRFEANGALSPTARLESKLSYYKHQLATVKHRHRAAASWVTTVVQPIFSIMDKRLNREYQGQIINNSANNVSVQFINRQQPNPRSLILNMTLLEENPGEEKARVDLKVVRSLYLPEVGKIEDQVPLHTSISQLVMPLCAA
jgi:hypothetical protein